ncbi:MAG: TAXI family TRAP transporter solute-binding subunit [Desulfobacterales bacterium]|nr:TAXI family TRAP transporter solute-binding subunit [Desulfobacterales bacterium]
MKDPSIKTINDLKGKKVVMASKGMAAGYVNQYILEKHGLWDKIKPQYMGYKPGATALADGLVDAVIVMITIPGPGKYSVVGAFTELLASKDVHLVHGGDEKTILAVGEEKNIEVIPVTLSGTFDGKPVPRGVTTFYQGVQWDVDETMDDEIVYEIVKILYENIDQIRATHPSMKVITRASLPNVSTAANFHKGAKKFYREVGLNVGFKGIQ